MRNQHNIKYQSTKNSNTRIPPFVTRKTELSSNMKSSSGNEETGLPLLSRIMDMLSPYEKGLAEIALYNCSALLIFVFSSNDKYRGPRDVARDAWLLVKNLRGIL